MPPELTDAQLELVRGTIEPTVEEWRIDYRIPEDKSHPQLVNRIVAAVVAMHQSGLFKDEPPRQQSLACGD